jgi:hypothetical protein
MIRGRLGLRAAGRHPDGMTAEDPAGPVSGSPHRGDAHGRVCYNASPMEAFWTIVSYAVVFGIAGLVGYLFYYWFVLMPRRLDSEGPEGR